MIADVWPAIEARVQAALDHGGDNYQLPDVRSALESGEWQLWGDGRSIICTRLAEYPSKRVLFIIIASGELHSIKAMWPTLKDFARHHGCSAMMGYARPGWRRSGGLPDGWRHVKDVIAVEF